MDSKLNKGDRKILSLVALYRILTVSQLAALTQRSRQVIRRRLRYLYVEGFIMTSNRGYGRISGRPEKIIFLTDKSAGILKKKGLFPENIPLVSPKNINAIPVDHDLLINWFYIHLTQVENLIPDLGIKPWSPGFIMNSQGSYGFFDLRIRIESDDDFTEFIPDGVFAIWHKRLQKGLLFFLEVDMDTEPVASMNRNHNDIRQKILNYQAIFRNGYYKQFENLFRYKFNGFRLLFLANSSTRSTSLSRLAREMPPSDFIWFVNQEKMFSDGLSAKIWVRGGKTEGSPQSIIGSNMATMAPIQIK